MKMTVVPRSACLLFSLLLKSLLKKSDVADIESGGTSLITLEDSAAKYTNNQTVGYTLYTVYNSGERASLGTVSRFRKLVMENRPPAIHFLSRIWEALIVSDLV